MSSEMIVSNPRKGQNGGLFWPMGRKQLRLEFETRTDGVFVRGFDIEQAAQLVFSAVLSPGQEDGFVDAVRAGMVPARLSPSVKNENLAALKTPLAAAIVIIDTGDDGNGPKYRLELPKRDSAALGTGTQG